MEELNRWVNKVERLNWNSYYAGITLLASARSPCERLRVGCILVKDKRIIGMGYNGFLPNSEHESIVINDHEQATSHAESNCVANAARAGVSTLDSTAYVTHHPCINCYKLLVSAGVKKIYYINDYKNSDLVRRLIVNSGIEVEKMTFN